MSEPTPQDYKDAVNGIGPLAPEWADKPHRLVYDLVSALTIATQRAEAAEAENERLRKAWQSADTTAQALSMNAGYIDVDGLRVGVHMVRSWLERMKVIDTENDLLQAEREALRKDAALLREFVSSDEIAMTYQTMGQYRAALLKFLTAAMAVQPTTSTGDPT